MLTFLLVFLCVLAAVSAEAYITGTESFYVAKDGNDKWSGKIAAPNKDRTDGPFATIEHARDAAREFKAANKEKPLEIYVRKGTYFLDKPLTFASQDSGLHISAYPGESVTISGGKEITGFKWTEVNGHKVLAAEIPEVKEGKWYFTQLFVNNRRMPRTRLPKEGFYNVAGLAVDVKQTQWGTGQDAFKFTPGNISASWKNLSDVDILALHLWVESRMQIKSVDESKNTVYLNKPSVFRLTDGFEENGAPYCVENVFEALDQPGQWYLDRPTGTLYYYPFTGQDVNNLKAIAPRLEQIITVGKASDKPDSTTGISLRNLRFAHTEPVHPAEKGGYAQAAFGVPGAISFRSAANCNIDHCEISNIGTYAVQIGENCSSIAVTNNKICDLGAGGIKAETGSEKSLISDNDIFDGGKIFMSGEGVYIANSPQNTVIHNNIHDFNYTGVSVGWVWGYGESKAKNNTIEYNHIYNIGRGVLSDMGGIYTLGISPGTRLCNNLIHDCNAHSYGGWGIYTDEGSSGILIENNIVYNTKTGGFHQHYGKENTVRNNIFAFAVTHQIQKTRPEQDHIPFFFDHNIIYYNQGYTTDGNWDDNTYKMDYNIYYDASGRPLNFKGVTLEEWQKRGHDVHSKVADPMFVDPAHYNFTLKPDSPALKMGFKPIDISTVGPRGEVGPQAK